MKKLSVLGVIVGATVMCGAPVFAPLLAGANAISTLGDGQRVVRLLLPDFAAVHESGYGPNRKLGHLGHRAT